jgi:hypothetical protein
MAKGGWQMMLAIDPGNIESAYVSVNEETYKPISFDKEENRSLLRYIRSFGFDYNHACIESVSSYGMAVGKEVFETCIWIGKFYMAINYEMWIVPSLIYRKDVKMNLCNSAKAKDSNIIQALKDRFGDKGTKATPGWFYGFSKDVWQAYALAVTYIDMMKGLYKC